MNISEIEKKVFPSNPKPQDAGEMSAKMATFRVNCARFLVSLDELVPDGREKSIAVTEFETMMMWAVKGITRDGVCSIVEEWWRNNE